MSIKIGENIKMLRKKQDITQERLAEYLGVSHQAVSKWESGDIYPDISLLPRIANMFGTSMDELFSYNEEINEKRIEEISKKYHKFLRDGDLKSAEDLIREGIKEFPRNYNFMLYLASNLIEKYNSEEKNKAFLEEVIQNIEVIVNECTDDNIRINAKRKLAKCYDYLRDSEKALEIAKSIPFANSDIFISVLHGEEKYKRCQQHVLSSFTSMSGTIVLMALMNKRLWKNLDSAIKLLDICKQLYELFCGEEDLKISEGYLKLNHMYANVYSELGEYTKCIEPLKKHVEFVVNMDNNIRKGKYSSVLFDRLEVKEDYGHSQAYMMKLALEELNNNRYDKIRETAEFKEIEELLKSAMSNQSN